MFISWDELRKLPVYTEGGTHLGRIVDMEIEVESHLVRAYFVRRAFLSDTLSVARGQILSITLEKVVVDDGAVKEKIKEAKKMMVREEISPVSMTEMEN